MKEKMNEIHEKVAIRQKELNQRKETSSKRVEEVKNSTYEERRKYKTLLSVIPYTALMLGGIGLSMSGLIPSSIVPVIAVFGGKFIGDSVESILYNKMNNNEFQEIGNKAKENRKIYLEIENENAKCEAYINEYEYNHTLLNDNVEGKKNKNIINYKKLNESKDKYQSRLKDINTRLVLAKNYRIYESKKASLCKHLGKTLLWTSELVLAYLLSKSVISNVFFTKDLIIPFLIGCAFYGEYNMSIMKTRLNLFNKYNKLHQTEVSLDDIESIEKYQKEYIKKIGNIKVIEVYKKCIDELEKKKLNTDPIEKDYENVKSNYVKPKSVNKYVYKTEDKYPNTIEVTYTENGNKILRRKK